MNAEVLMFFGTQQRRRWQSWALAAAGLVISAGMLTQTLACLNSSGGSSSFLAHQLTVEVVQVQNAARTPQEGLRVTLWVIDVDEAGQYRTPLVLAAEVTDAMGVAQFTFASIDPPYICGYEIRNADEDILASHPPLVADILSSAAGQLTVEIP